MPFPTRGWPPPAATGLRSFRVYLTGTATADFEDNAFLFIDVTGANTINPLPVVEPGEDVSDPSYSGPHDVGSPPWGTGDNGSEGSAGEKPAIWSSHIAISATGGAVEFSFDGVNVHGSVPSGERYEFSDRYEAGISVRGAGSDYTIEAW